MKKTITLILGLMMCVVVHGQGLTVRFDNCTVEQAMEQLKGLGVSFVLKSDQVNLGSKVDAEFKDASL